MPKSKVSNEDDAILIKRAKSGDPQSFGVLYERYATDIYRFIRAQIPDQLEAEDLTANTFLKAWDGLRRYRERGFPFSSFLYRIARNTLIDHWRKQNREIQSSGLIFADLENEPSGSRGNPQNRIELQVFWQVIHELPENYRTVLVYRFINDLNPREIAAIMGKSVGSVRVLQHRALKAARKLIVEVDIFHEES